MALSKEEKLQSLRSMMNQIQEGTHQAVPSVYIHQEPTATFDDSCTFEESEAETKPKDFSEDAAVKKIIRYLSYSDRSCDQVRSKLYDAGFQTEQVEGAIERALRAHLLDDDRYLRSHIASKMRAGKGRYGLERTLAHEGFSATQIADAFDDTDFAEEDEAERAYAFLCSHRPTAKNVRDSAFRKLVSKGYSVAAASSAAKRYVNEEHF